jgi:hypothetical protein
MYVCVPMCFLSAQFYTPQWPGSRRIVSNYFWTWRCGPHAQESESHLWELTPYFPLPPPPPKIAGLGTPQRAHGDQLDAARKDSLKDQILRPQPNVPGTPFKNGMMTPPLTSSKRDQVRRAFFPHRIYVFSGDLLGSCAAVSGDSTVG